MDGAYLTDTTFGRYSIDNMDWKTLRRDKLAKTAPYSPRRWQDSWWWRGVSETLADWWARFEAFPVWEKGMVLGSLVLIAVIAPVAIFAIGGGGGSAAAPPPTATLIGGVGVHATATPVPTFTPTPTFTTIPTRTPKLEPTPFSQDCDEIRGRPYQSDEEREWFLENCLNPTPEDEPTPTLPGALPTIPPGPGPGPAPSPTPRLTLTTAQAAGIAEDWVLSEPTLSELELVPGSCSAQASGDHWVVSCRASTTGCVGACEFTLRICVEEGPLSVRQC